MTNRLARSVPFWVLLLASLASIGVGLWLVLTKVSEMSATLADGSATYEQVYVSPAWIGFGGVLVGAGILGLLLVLTLAALRSALPAPAAETAIVEETVIVEEAAPVAEQAPVFEDADVETSTTDTAPPGALPPNIVRREGLRLSAGHSGMARSEREQRIDSDRDEQQRQVGDGCVEHTHRPWLRAPHRASVENV